MTENKLILSYMAEIKALKSENKTLKHRIAQLEDEVDDAVKNSGIAFLNQEEDLWDEKYNVFRLAPKSLRLFMLFVRNEQGLSRQGAVQALYVGSTDKQYYVDTKVIDVMVCKLRNVLEASGLPRDTVETVWGRGYRIKPEYRDQLLQRIGYTPPAA